MQGLYCAAQFQRTEETNDDVRIRSGADPGTRQVIDLNGGVRVKDPAALRGETIDRLVHTAVFGQGDVRAAARWLIWEAGWEVGIQSASIDALYQARARGSTTGMTVPGDQRARDGL